MLQSVEEVIRLRKELFVKSVTVAMTNQNAGYGLPEAMDREMTFIANRLRDYGVRVIDSFPLHSETPKVDTYHAECTPDNMASFVAFYKAMMAGIATDEIIQAGKNQFLLHQRSVVFSNAFRLAREVSAAQARTMSLDDMEPPPADAECPPAERVPEEEIVFEGPIMHEIPEIRQFVEEGGEELTAQDLACLNPSPGGDDVIHPDYDLSIPEVARVAEIVEAANSVIDDDAAKVIEAEDDEIEQILFLQPNMVLEDHTLHNQGTTPKALPKSTPPTESRFFSGTAMDSASSALPDSSPSAVSSAAGTSHGDRDLKPVAKKAGAKKPRQVTEQWILCNQLEDLPDDHFWMTTPARECLGKKMTFIMRGWSNNKKGTPKVHFDRQGSVVWSEFLDALSQIWNGLRMSQVFECLLYGDKARYELLIRSDPSLEELEVLKIRSVQGHGGDLLSDEMDLSEIHKNIFALSDNWRPTLGQRPPVGTQGFLHPNFDTMPMMGYHATKLRNFESVVEYGLFPGGLSADGSPGRVFVMMSAEPEWIRTDNSGARKTAEIEFVIDLQLHALEGGRVMETKIGVLQTADWVSNRHLIYAYHRGSGEPFWFNRAYENKTRPRYPFTILGYDRKRYVFDDREVSLLLAKLADFFTSQLPLSVPEKEKDDRLQLPTIVLTKPLDDIPEGLAGLGERQLFAMIENTRFGTYRRDPTNVERRLRRSEGQTRASAPPAGRRGRSPTAANIEPKAKAGRGRSASPFVGHGRGRSSSARQPSLIETDQPGVLLARPPPPPPVRHVTEYISAEEWDAIRAGTYGNFAPRERTRSRTRDNAAAPAAPEGGIPAPATPPGGDDYHGQQFIGLQNVPRSAGDVSIGRILQVRDRLLKFWTITFRIMILISGIRSLTTAPATSTHLDDLAPMATHALRAIFGQS